jgi:hypothetical protein
MYWQKEDAAYALAAVAACALVVYLAASNFGLVPGTLSFPGRRVAPIAVGVPRFGDQAMPPGLPQTETRPVGDHATADGAAAAAAKITTAATGASIGDLPIPDWFAFATAQPFGDAVTPASRHASRLESERRGSGETSVCSRRRAESNHGTGICRPLPNTRPSRRTHARA